MIYVCCRSLLIFLIISLINITGSIGFAASTPRMRPYTGIGLVVFSTFDAAGKQEVSLRLYREPGLSLVGALKSSRLPGNEWIFGSQKITPPLIVSARKGDWLRVFYDDGGREAWIDPRPYGRFYTWEHYLKMQTGHLLPGLQPQYYRLFDQPDGDLLRTVTPNQVVKVIALDKNWAMVLTEQTQIGWLRWCDDDGRLLMGIGP